MEFDQSASRELEKVMFRLTALHDASKELGLIEDDDTLAETFLLLVMGAFGVGSGCVVIAGQEEGGPTIKSKGLERGDAEAIRQNLNQLGAQYSPLSSGKSLSARMVAEIVPKGKDGTYPLFPPTVEIIIRWSLDRNTWGFLGLGRKILDEGYGESDLVSLLSFTRDYMFHLNRLRSEKTINRMEREIVEKESKLKASHADSNKTKRALEKHLFHQKALSDTAREAVTRKHPEMIMETFLLGIMGAFSIAEGFMLLVNRKEKEIHLTGRGLEREKAGVLSEEDMDELTHQLFQLVERHGLSGTELRMITDRDLLETVSIPFEVTSSLLFLVNTDTVGLLGLGKMGIREDPMGEGLAFLQQILCIFAAYYENACSAMKIEQLEGDLGRKANELTNAVKKVSDSSLKIDVLEKARKGIAAAVQSEMRKARRVSALDFLLILAVAVTLGLLYNYSNPGGISLFPASWRHPPVARIDDHWAKIKYDAGNTLFVDARPPTLYQVKRVRGAMSLPITVFDFVYMMKFSMIDPKKEVIVYGRNISRLYDEEVALKLGLRGHSNVKILAGGLSAWEKKGYPLEP